MIKNLFYIFGFVALAAVCNGFMDVYGFRYNDYGWQWHVLKILMQGCYAMSGWFIFLFSDRYADILYVRFKYWTIALMWFFIFAFLTGLFHEQILHGLYEKLLIN